MSKQKSKKELDLLNQHPLALPVVSLIAFGTTFAVYFVLNIFWGEHIIITFDDLWKDGDVLAGLSSVWFIYAWGACLTLVIGYFSLSSYRSHSPGRILAMGTWLSINAGVFEELIYRWLRFSIALVILPFLNFILFGFIDGFDGVIHWVYDSVLIPVADWVTFGALHEWLYHPAGWVVGAAILSANGKFRGAHLNNGILNCVNAWFIGMVMFFLVFEYGLLTAIIAHIVYDVVIFACRALVASYQPVKPPSISFL